MLLSAGALILCGYVNDAVCVDIEGNLDLGYSAGCGRNSVENEASEGGVARCHLALALKDVDLNLSLVVICGRINLALLYGNSGISVDDLIEYAAEGLDTEGQGSYVEKKEILNLTAENAALNCCTDSYALIGLTKYV